MMSLWDPLYKPESVMPSMDDRLSGRDAEREQIARAAQARLEPDRETYNQMVMNPPRQPVENTPVSSSEGSEEFRQIMEAEFDLSTMPVMADEAMGTGVDLTILSERVDALEGA